MTRKHVSTFVTAMALGTGIWVPATWGAYQYMDQNGASNGLGNGTSTWSTSTNAWTAGQAALTPVPGGNTAPVAWTDGNDAVFYRASRTANVSGTIEVASMRAEAQGSNQNVIIGGSGTLNLAGGITLVNAGNYPTLTVNSSVVLNLASGSLASFTTSGGTASNFTMTLNANIGETVLGSGIYKASAMTLTLAGNNTFTGGVRMDSGVLNINHAGALGTGDFRIDGGTINNNSAGAIVNANNNTQTWNGNFTFTGTQDLDLGAGAVSLGAAAGTSRTITVSAKTLKVGGAIANGTTANALTKAGNGTLVLGGGNTYTGGTTLSGGSLLVNGSLAGGNVSVGANTTLGGNGAIGGAVTVNGTLAPGNSIDTLTVNNNVTFNAGSIFSVELGAGVADKLVVNGNLALATTGAGVTLNLLGTADNLTSYVIAKYSGTLTGTFASPVLPAGYSLDYGTGNNSQITLTIPEPASIVLLTLGGLLMLPRRSKKA